MSANNQTRLKGEGERQFFYRVRARIECEQCGEPATKKRTYLFPRARTNPKSAGYGRDDCSWCEDAAVFTCDSCKPIAPDGMEFCAEFTCEYRFSNLFLRTEERLAPAVTALVEAAQRVTNAFYGTSHFADRRPEQEPSMAEHKANDELNNSVANLLTALAPFTEKEPKR